MYPQIILSDMNKNPCGGTWRHERCPELVKKKSWTHLMAINKHLTFDYVYLCSLVVELMNNYDRVLLY